LETSKGRNAEDWKVEFIQQAPQLMLKVPRGEQLPEAIYVSHDGQAFKYESTRDDKEA
jgi:hypothetical protein